MKQYYETNKLEVGIDEAGRGSLLGPVCVAAVIMNDINDNPTPYEIKDSKKCSPKKRKALKEYIEENAVAYSVQFISEKESIQDLYCDIQFLHPFTVLKYRGISVNGILKNKNSITKINFIVWNIKFF